MDIVAIHNTAVYGYAAELQLLALRAHNEQSLPAKKSLERKNTVATAPGQYRHVAMSDQPQHAEHKPRHKVCDVAP